MRTLQAIDTIYRGFRFRSRTEARWAKYFDTMSLSWDYEPCSFRLPDGTGYRPDFLVRYRQWVVFHEIKPSHEIDDGKCDLFRKVLRGSPWFGDRGSLGMGVPNGNCTGATVLIGDPLAVVERSKVCPRCGEIERGSIGTGCEDVWCESCIIESHRYPTGQRYEGIAGAVYIFNDRGAVSQVSGTRLWQLAYSAAAEARATRFDHTDY